MPLLLLVATMAGLLGGCSLSTPLCDEGDALVAAAQPARALEVYARAKAQGDGCAEQGLDTASTNQRRAAEEAARGEAAERAGDSPAATAAYQAALPLDVTNTLAVAGLARLGQKPVPPPPVTTQPPEPSWWAGPWPYFLSSVLISALLAGAVLWFVQRQMAGLRTRLSKLEKKAATSDRRLNDVEKSQQSDHDRLDEAQKHIQTKLDRALRLQKERIDHLTELIDLSTQTQAEPTREAVVWLEPRSVAGEPANEFASDDEKANGTERGASADGAMSDGAMRVEVNIFAIGIGRGQSDQEQLVIQRVIERRVMERDDAGETNPSAHDDRKAPLTAQEPGPFEKAAADSIVDPVWERVQESWWVTPDYQGLADGAKWITGVETGWHDLVLGKPAERVALGAGFSPASADVMGVIAAKIVLPGDNTFKDVRRLVQFAGIALGVASGAAPLANACISSLAHDLLAELTAKAFREAIAHVLEPVRSVERPIPAREMEPEGARARQLHSDLVAAEPRQRAHELESREREAQQRLEEQRLERIRLEEIRPEERWLDERDGPWLER
ncbi:MAG: hypothetical protein ACRDQY_14440 [Pseudonocardiaceae bacterium]